MLRFKYSDKPVMAIQSKILRQALLIGACFFLSSLAIIAQNPALEIIKRPIKGGFKPAGGRNIKAIIIHATFNKSGGDSFSVEGCVRQFERYGVSAHYIIDRKGTVFELVKPEFISYHAGKSQLPDGEKAVNSTSLGIEIISAPGSGPTQAQYSALASLIDKLKSDYPQVKYLLGHSDIAPHRKTDPWDFNFPYLKSLVKGSFIWPVTLTD